MTSCRSQNTSRILHLWGLAPYPYKVVSRRHQSTVSYAFWRSRKTRKGGSWSKLYNSCVNLSSKMDVPVLLPAWKPWRTSCRWTISLRQVSMIASTTFHTNYTRPTPQASVLPLGVRTRIIYPISDGISLCLHMNWVIYNSFCHQSGLGGVGFPSDVYASCINFLQCYARRWVYNTALWSRIQHTAASTYSSKGVSSLNLKCVTWVDTGLPGGLGSSHRYSLE